MKKLFLLSIILSGALVYAVSFEVGDTIDERYNREKPEFILHETEVMNFKLQVRSKKTEIMTGDYVYLCIDGHNFGILVYDESEKYIFDLDGDNVLDVEMQQLFIPIWVFEKSEQFIKDPSKNNIKEYLDLLLAAFNDNENPYSSGKLESLKRKLSIVDVRHPNQDLQYALFMYYACLGISSDLDKATLAIFDRIYCKRFSERTHPLIVLHMLETYINMGNRADAEKLLETGIREYPSFIPFQVYSWQLERDAILKKQKYDSLKNTYPNHWIVKQI
ncbi:hypothetical protein H0R92_06550 [Treponema sp. OMZ 840]|uniref:hypothetical protein n=1 Tax=Treponema sp. OMZ 840 TaxID=244313 RepID=UPI003D8BF302